MKRAVIAFCLIGLSQPVVGQSFFDDLGGTGDAMHDRESAEFQQWKRAVAQKIMDHTPAVSLVGRGRVTVNFCVDPAGRVAKIDLPQYASNAHALVAIGTISSLELPPPPPSVRAMTKGSCVELSQTFWYN